MNNKELDLTAAEEVLLAAAKLQEKCKKEFTEWALTVETWSLNKVRWGLQGYEEKYPNHKRVMNEVMAGGTQKVVGRGWLQKVRPNYYKVTPAGFAKAESLGGIKLKKTFRNVHQYDALSPYINSNIFIRYCKDPSEPKTWLGSAAFLGLSKHEPEVLERKISNIKASISESRKWMKENNKKIISRSDSTRPITEEILNKLEEFLKVLEERFKAQFDAIRARKK